MNRLMIIGNLTGDPESRVTATGKNVCNFTVAGNRRCGNEADFFRVSAWEKNAENCGKFLSKGRKVCVVGPVSVRTYQANNGETRASLEVTANEVEFLSSRNEGNSGNAGNDGFTVVNVEDDPFA